MDFNEYMACCSANYQRLHNILSGNEFAVGSSQSCQIGDMGNLRLNIKQKQAYTDTIEILFESLSISKWIGNLYFEIKMYHDAQLVEVSGYNDPQKQNSKISSPTSQKLFPYWEKWQTNKLLSEILTYYYLQPK